MEPERVLSGISSRLYMGGFELPREERPNPPRNALVFI